MGDNDVIDQTVLTNVNQALVNTAKILAQLAEVKSELAKLSAYAEANHRQLDTLTEAVRSILDSGSAGPLAKNSDKAISVGSRPYRTTG